VVEFTTRPGLIYADKKIKITELTRKFLPQYGAEENVYY